MHVRQTLKATSGCFLKKGQVFGLTVGFCVLEQELARQIYMAVGADR